MVRKLHQDFGKNRSPATRPPGKGGSKSNPNGVTSRKRRTGRLIRLRELMTALEIARVCGVTTQAVYQWRDVPARFALKLEKATAGTLPRTFLAPEIYPSEQ